jgi:hypothetical protein
LDFVSDFVNVSEKLCEGDDDSVNEDDCESDTLNDFEADLDKD